MSDKPSSEFVKIICPKCQRIQDAVVEKGPILGFDNYVHECIGCTYVITESEWEEIERWC
jgi:hypothetical protein